MNRARPGPLLLLAALSLTTAMTGPALAQDGTGIRAKLSFSTGLSWSDNKRLDPVSPGDTLTSVTDLGFRMTSETRNQRLNFGLDGRLETSGGDGSTDQDDFRLSRKGANLDYLRQNSNTRLRFQGRVNEVEVDDDFFGFFVDGEFDPNALIVDNGTVRRTSFLARIETGLEGPFGFDLTARRSTRKYSNTTDETLEDRTRNQLDATAQFRLNPGFGLRARAGYRDTEEEDELDTLDTQTTYIGFGVQNETAGGLTIVGDILFDKSTTDREFGEDSKDDGVGFELAVTQARTNGEIGFDASSRIDDSGRRTSASVRRAIDLPTGGFAFSLGLVDQEDKDIAFISSLDYFRETPVGTVTANLVQAPSTDAGEAFLNTSFNLGIVRSLTPVSEIGANVRFGASRGFGDDDRDRRTTIGLNYRRDITRDWDLTAGYEYARINDDDDDGRRSSNTVFFNIGRDFDFGF